jgi:hypothetical protein
MIKQIIGDNKKLRSENNLINFDIQLVVAQAGPKHLARSPCDVIQLQVSNSHRIDQAENFQQWWLGCLL